MPSECRDAIAASVDHGEPERLAVKLLEAHAVKGFHGNWDYAGEQIIEAQDAGDLELLRVYERLLVAPFSNASIGLITHIVRFARRAEYPTDAITPDFVYALNDLEDELPRRTISIMSAQLFDPRHDPLRAVLVENLHRYREVMALVRTRNITDGAVMRAVLAEMDGAHPSVASGVL
jgi:hypothetical protein